MARRKKQNEFPIIPIVGATSFYSTGTTTNDVSTTNIMPSDGWVGHSTILGITNGTGTGTLNLTVYGASAKGAPLLCGPAKDASGNLYTLASAAGVVYTADGVPAGTGIPLNEGSRLFLNMDIATGTATGAGTFAFALMLVL